MNIQHIAETLGLKKCGSEYKGPCPICGGNDRFHIKSGKEASLLMLCRQGCTFSSLMRYLEDRGLVEKSKFVHPHISQSNLDYCDSLLMVVCADIENDKSFNAEDMLAVSRMIPLVDPERQQLLHGLLNKMRDRL